MKINSEIVVVLFKLASLISLIVTAVFLTEMIDLTIQNGLVIHQQYVPWALVSVFITALLFYLKRHFSLNSHEENDE